MTQCADCHCSYCGVPCTLDAGHPGPHVHAGPTCSAWTNLADPAADAPEAKASVERFIGNAKAIALLRFECALRTIARLRWWECWKAPDLAAKALGIFKYWNREWRDDDFHLNG